MTTTADQAHLMVRRAELLVELFLEELGPLFVARPSGADFGFDFFVGFRNRQGGLNVSAVEVKATATQIDNRFTIQRKLFDRLVYSNIPVILIVADVKRNQLYWANVALEERLAEAKTSTVRVPLRQLNQGLREELRRHLAGDET